MTDERRKLLDLLKPLLPITEEMERQIFRFGHRMVIETTIAVKVIIERRNDKTWVRDPNESGIVVTIIYGGKPGPDPLQITFAVERLFDAILAMGITEDAPISFVCDDEGHVFQGDTIIDENGKEWTAPRRNVLERLDAVVKTITAEEAGFPPPWK